MYDEKVLVGLDFAINEASKRGIRVVPVFANYWAMYGGIDQYNTWSFEAGSGELPPCSRPLSAAAREYYHVLCLAFILILKAQLMSLCIITWNATSCWHTKAFLQYMVLFRDAFACQHLMESETAHL